MIVFCIIRKDNDDAVELFTDVKEAYNRQKQLQDEGEANIVMKSSEL